MIQNKNEIIDFIKKNPSVTKKATVEIFGVSVVTISRLRKKIQDELDKTRIICPSPRETETLTKPNIQAVNDTHELEPQNFIKLDVQMPVQAQNVKAELTTPQHMENITKPDIAMQNDIAAEEDKNLRKPKLQPAEYECIARCYWNERLYQKGVVYLLNGTDIPKHFRLYDSDNPVLEPTLDDILASVGHSRQSQMNI